MAGDLDLLIGKWTVRVKNWTWEYEFHRDGRVTWRDPGSAEKGSGNWAATKKLVNMWWKDSKTRESWQRPLTASNDHTWYESSYFRGKYRIEKKTGGPIPVPPGPAPGPSPAPSPSAQGAKIEQTVGILARIFTYRSPWKIVSSGGGAGGYGVISAGGGKIDVANDQTAEKRTIAFVAAGASLGLTPASLTFSTPNMYSVPGLEQTRIRARTPQPLQFDDLTGPMAVASFTATSVVYGAEGGSLSIYFFGLPGLVALTGLIIPGAAGLIGSAALNCKAMGMTAGEVRGADASVSASIGYGW